MKLKTVLDALATHTIPEGGPQTIFLLPHGGMEEIYQLIVEKGLKNCLELGSGFGATSCVMGAAAEEIGGKVTTIDLHRPIVCADILKKHAGIGDALECLVDPLGYNWWLADVVRAQTGEDGVCAPIYDMVFLDGAHEWQPDALASTLAIKLLKPGGWLVLDDLNFNLRMIPNCKQSHGHLTDRELDAFQLEMVWSLVIRQHPELRNFHVTQDNRIGWAQKKPVQREARPKSNRWMSRLVGAR